ncbi:MAG: hypothetical protein EZS28_020823, partial [Streblomastix strix]
EDESIQLLDITSEVKQGERIEEEINNNNSSQQKKSSQQNKGKESQSRLDKKESEPSSSEIEGLFQIQQSSSKQASTNVGQNSVKNKPVFAKDKINDEVDLFEEFDSDIFRDEAEQRLKLWNRASEHLEQEKEEQTKNDNEKKKGKKKAQKNKDKTQNDGSDTHIHPVQMMGYNDDNDFNPLSNL